MASVIDKSIRDLKDIKEDITIRLKNMKKKAEKNHDPPSVVISGAWNIPGTLSWYELKGKGNRTNRELEEIGSIIKKDVETITERVINLEWKIIVGGALGVDYFAAQKVYDMGKLDQLFIILYAHKYTCYENLTKAYFDRDIITFEQVEKNNSLLEKISKESPASIYQPRFNNFRKELYLIRNSREAYFGDFLCAFHVDNTEGTRDTIEKFIESKKPVYIHRYEVLKDGWSKEHNQHIYNIDKSPISEGEIEEIFGLSKRIYVRY